MARQCSRSGCSAAAVATLSYVYADRTAVLGPLAGQAEPGTYDLCLQHARTLSVPRGWQIIRLEEIPTTPPPPDADDLMALAHAVRSVGLATTPEPPAAEMDKPLPENVIELGRRGHLRMIADSASPR